MSERETQDGFERELTAGLERIAPRPRRDAVDRTMRTVAETPQRSGWSVGLSRFGSLIEWRRVVAVGAVAAVAMVVGIAIGTSGLLSAGNESTPTPQPSSSPVAVAWVEPADYQFVLEQRCGLHSVLGTFAVTVEDRQVAGSRTIAVQPARRDVPIEEVPTLGELVRRADELQASGEAEVVVALDPSDGHPTSVRFTWPEHSTKNFCYEITEYTPLASPSAAPTPEVADVFDEWTRVALPDPAPGVFGGAVPYSVVDFRGGYIAVGTVNADCCDGGDPSARIGLVWSADTPESWGPDVLQVEHSSFSRILLFDDQLLIVGSYAEPGSDLTRGGPPALWRSTDGVSWERIEGDLPSMVVVGPEGFVGARVESTESDGEVSWTSTFMESPDGRTWTATPEAFPVEVRAMAAGSDGLVMAAAVVEGTPWPDGTPSHSVVTYVSEGTGGWTAHEGALERGAIFSLTAARGRFYGTGWREEEVGNGSFARVESIGTVWVSRTGVGWEALPMPVAAGHVMQIYDAGTALVAFGDGLWISQDAITWKRVPDQESLQGLEWIPDIIALDDGLLAIGAVWDPVSSHPLPVAWVSQSSVHRLGG